MERPWCITTGCIPGSSALHLYDVHNSVLTHPVYLVLTVYLVLIVPYIYSGNRHYYSHCHTGYSHLCQAILLHRTKKNKNFKQIKKKKRATSTTRPTLLEGPLLYRTRYTTAVYQVQHTSWDEFPG